MIYIATHKKFKKPNLTNYVELQVGAEGKEDLGYILDNQGENISEKNSNYCELTGVYWIWKNIRSNIVGLVHYRRYFTKAKLSTNEKYFLTYDEAKKYLNFYDIILAKSEPLKETAWEEYYMVSGLEKDLKKLKKIIESKYPEYLNAFEIYFDGNSSHLYNMMICRKELFDEYSEWLFDILFTLEPTVDFSEYNDYQKRIFGFLSERLLNVWVSYKRLKIKELRVVNLGMSNQERMKLFFRRYKNRIIFKIRRIIS